METSRRISKPAGEPGAHAAGGAPLAGGAARFLRAGDPAGGSGALLSLRSRWRRFWNHTWIWRSETFSCAARPSLRGGEVGDT